MDDTVGKALLQFFMRCFLLRGSNPQDCNFHSSNRAQIPDLSTPSQRTCFHSHGLTVTEQLIQDNWHNHSSSSKLPLPHLFSLPPPKSSQHTVLQRTAVTSISITPNSESVFLNKACQLQPAKEGTAQSWIKSTFGCPAPSTKCSLSTWLKTLPAPGNRAMWEEHLAHSATLPPRYK